MKYLIPSIAAALVCCPVYAQRAVVETRGCGTSCRIETRQLSKPQRMGNGWVKVLVSEQAIATNLDGIDELLPRMSGQYWLFANCLDSLIGTGQSSDRSDAQFTGIYTSEGAPKNVSASGNLYERYKALCRSAGY